MSLSLKIYSILDIYSIWVINLQLFTYSIKQFSGVNMSKVLIVDDTAFMRKLLKSILFGAGFDIAGEAENGKQAIEQYKSLKPDIVTMDVVMPEMTGIDALKQIKSIDKDAKIVMCTAVGQEKIVKTAIKLGARGYIIKPFQAPKVIEEIKKVIGE
jgi:two-component system chemotaxis response regulator CheY